MSPCTPQPSSQAGRRIVSVCGQRQLLVRMFPLKYVCFSFLLRASTLGNLANGIPSSFWNSQGFCSSKSEKAQLLLCRSACGYIRCKRKICLNNRMAVTEVTKDRQVYDTKEEPASEIWATAIKIQNKGTAEALKDRVFLSISFFQWLLSSSWRFKFSLKTIYEIVKIENICLWRWNITFGCSYISRANTLLGSCLKFVQFSLLAAQLWRLKTSLWAD